MHHDVNNIISNLLLDWSVDYNSTLLRIGIRPVDNRDMPYDSHQVGSSLVGQLPGEFVALAFEVDKAQFYKFMVGQGLVEGLLDTLDGSGLAQMDKRLQVVGER